MDVTPTIRRVEEKGAAPVPAAMEHRSAISQSPVVIEASGTGQATGWHVAGVEQPYWHASTVWVRQQPWYALLIWQCQGSAGIVSCGSGYGPLLPHVGSSPLIVDRRSMARTPAMINTWLSAGGFDAVPVADQLKELRSALSLNKSQLARILQVTRPTIYEWYEGKEPNATNSERIRTLLRVLVRGAVSGARPLNARFVRQPAGLAEPSLLDLLCEDRLDQEHVARALKRARNLGAAAFRKRKNREDRLRALGFEDPSGDQRKELLARNVALHPRVLQLAFEAGATSTVLVCSVHDRWTIPQDLLLREAPQEQLADKERRLVAEWLAKRYIRAAFPTAFDRRWHTKRTAWHKLLQRHSEWLQGVYLRLNTLDELPEDAPYLCDFILAVPSARQGGKGWSSQRHDLEREVQVFWDQFKPGIECSGVEPLGTDEITLAGIELYQRFDSDWVSFDDDTATTPHTVDMRS